MEQKNILWFNEVTKKDINQVGGKNGSLGEMFSQLTPKGVNVPNGFATTAHAYWYYLKYNGIDQKLIPLFKGLNVQNLKQLKK